VTTVGQDRGEETADFGKFNDFNEVDPPGAPTLAASQAASQDDDFGDFGEFDGESTVAAPSVPEDPIVAKARIVLSHAFCAFASSAQDEKEENSPGSVATVKDILVSVQCKQLEI
jgi:hypothetical protein